MPNFPDRGHFSTSKRDGLKERGRRQVGEAVEGGQKGQLDGKPAGARISKGRNMPHVDVICLCQNFDLLLFVYQWHYPNSFLSLLMFSNKCYKKNILRINNPEHYLEQNNVVDPFSNRSSDTETECDS